MSEERVEGAGLSEEEFHSFMETIGNAAPLVRSLLHPRTSGDHKEGGGQCERREALLCALKPYLSRERCEAVDYLLRLWRVGDSIKALGGTYVHPTDT